MLDIQVWLERKEGFCRIRHSFYQKPTTSPLVFHSEGAHSSKSKILTLSEELHRRLLNMDTYHSWDDQKEVIVDFIQKMCDSGYDHPTRMEVILSGVKKYYRQVVEQETGGRRLYRSQEHMASSRKLKSLKNKTWFRNKRGGSKITPSKDLPWYSQLKEETAKETSNVKSEGRKTEEPEEL